MFKASINKLSLERLKSEARRRIDESVSNFIDAVSEEIKVTLQTGMGEDIEVVVTKEQKNKTTTKLMFASYGPDAIEKEKKKSVFNLTYANIDKILARITW